jgi:predicted nucleic acid-binding protein
MPAANRLSEAIPEPAMEDVKKLVQRILPRLRPILTTEELISEFLYEVVQQLAASNRQPSDKLAA